MCFNKSALNVKLEPSWPIEIAVEDVNQEIFFLDENVQLAGEIDLHNQLKHESTCEQTELKRPCKASNESRSCVAQLKKKKKKRKSSTKNVDAKRKYNSRKIKSKDLRPPGHVQCDICKNVLKNFECLRKHMRIKHRPNAAKIEDSDANASKPVELKPKKTYTCDICSSTLSNYVNLRIHMGKHIGVMQYTCYFCGKGFYNPSNMR